MTHVTSVVFLDARMGMIIILHRLYLYFYTTIQCINTVLLLYALLWHVLYVLVNIDQDQMKLILVNYIAGKKIALRKIEL